MCGRVIQSSGPLRLAIVEGLNAPDSRFSRLKPRYNGAPSQELLVIRENHATGQRSLDLLRWGLIPHWCDDPAGGRKPINAKAETVASLPTFRDAYARRRCVIPVDGFFEWQATKEGKRPYAIAMRDGSPFGIGGLWENWKSPVTGEWVRTFCIITTPANVMVSRIIQATINQGNVAQVTFKKTEIGQDVSCSRPLRPPQRSDDHGCLWKLDAALRLEHDWELCIDLDDHQRKQHLD